MQRQQVDTLTKERESAVAELRQERDERTLEIQAHAADLKQLQARLETEVCNFINRLSVVAKMHNIMYGMDTYVSGRCSHLR